MNLIEAAQAGDLDQVNLLLAQGAAVDQVDENGKTPLLLAAQNGHEAIVARLLQAGAQVNQANENGITPLLLAAQNDHEAIVAALLDAGAAVNQANSSGDTPLLLAALQGHEAIVAALLDAGAAVNQANSSGDTPLLLAALQGHEAIVDKLLQAGAVIDQANSRGWTPLLLAALQGHEAVVGRLLEAGAVVDQVNSDGETPLHVAAQNKHWKTFILLAAYGHRRDNQQKHVLNKKHIVDIIGVINSFLPNSTHKNILDIIEKTPNMPEDVKATLKWILSKPTDPLHHHDLALAEKPLAKMRPNPPPLALICKKFLEKHPVMLINNFIGNPSPSDKMLSRLHHSCATQVANLLSRAYRIPRSNLQFDQQREAQRAAQQHDFDCKHGLVVYTPPEAPSENLQHVDGPEKRKKTTRTFLDLCTIQ